MNASENRACGLFFSFNNCEAHGSKTITTFVSLPTTESSCCFFHHHRHLSRSPFAHKNANTSTLKGEREIQKHKSNYGRITSEARVRKERKSASTRTSKGTKEEKNAASRYFGYCFPFVSSPALAILLD